MFTALFWSPSHTLSYMAALYLAANSCMLVLAVVNKWLSWVQGTTMNDIIVENSSNKLISIHDFAFCKLTVASHC